jgi:peptidoglycan/LPS O-acetylase OafA/YrhL
MNIKNQVGLPEQKISYVHLDMARGLAAWAVVFGHLRNIFFQDYQAIASKSSNLIIKTAYFLSGFGHEAVIVFFVLSGFFITRSIMMAEQRGRWSWKWYLSQRLTRLWIVLIPALIMTAV